MLVCLLTDVTTLRRLGRTLNYLQVGLVDEAVEVLLAAPQGSDLSDVIAAPTRLIEYRPPAGMFPHRRRVRTAETLRQAIEQRRRDQTLILHSFSPATLALARGMATEEDASIHTLMSALDLQHPDLQSAAAEVAAWIVPCDAIQRAAQASPFVGRRMEKIRMGASTQGAAACYREAERAPSLVFAGELTDGCGALELLCAVQDAREDHPRLMTFILGGGPAEPRLRRAAQSMKLESAVIFTGTVPRWRDALEGADLFCAPRARSAHGEEPVHALALGLAVTAPDEQIYDCLIDGQTALLYPAGDSAQLGERIRRLLDDRVLARRLAEAGQNLIREQYSVSRMVDEHLRVYRQTITRNAILKLE